jgi:hypothetical protein
MRGFVRIAVCAVLIGAIVPTVALASPKGDARNQHVSVMVAEKLATAKIAALSLAGAPVDAWELLPPDMVRDDEWPGQMIADANLQLLQDRAITNTADTPDIDTYLLTATPKTQYTFETSGTIDTIITVYDADSGDVLAWFDDKSSIDKSSIGSWTANTGLTQVVIEISTPWDSNPVAQNGAYKMSITKAANTITAASVQRIAGATRYAVASNTAKAIYGPTWKKSNGTQVSDVIVVCGEDSAMADPLAAGSLAGWYEAPLLMTTKLSMPGDTSSAIAAIRNANGNKVNIHVIGGTASVTPAVYNKLSALKGTGTIERIEAKNRYALAAKVAQRLDTLYFAAYGEHPFEVYVANGQNPAAFYDALAASGYCYRWNAPLLLTTNTSVPSETMTEIDGRFVTSTIWAVNSSTYMPNSVYNAIYAQDRMSYSADRYQSALDIAQWGLFTYASSQDELVIVNKLPDALAAGTYAGAAGGVMLYIPATGPAGATATFLTNHKSTVSGAAVFGGTGSVTDAGYNSVYSKLNSN